MKPIRFALHCLSKALYKLGELLWAPVLVVGVWFAIGYLLSRLSVYRGMFTKGTPEWIMAFLSPLPTIGAIAGVLGLIVFSVVLSAEIWHIVLYIQNLRPITHLKDAYRNFK